MDCNYLTHLLRRLSVQSFNGQPCSWLLTTVKYRLQSYTKFYNYCSVPIKTSNNWICLVLRFSKCGLPFLYLQNWHRYCKVCKNFNLFKISKLDAVWTRGVNKDSVEGGKYFKCGARSALKIFLPPPLEFF